MKRTTSNVLFGWGPEGDVSVSFATDERHSDHYAFGVLYEPRQRFGVAAVGTILGLFALSAIRTSHVVVTALYLVLCLGFIVLPAFTLKHRAKAYEHRHLIGGVITGWLGFIGWNVLNVLASPSSSDVIGLILGAFIGSLASIIALRVIRKPPAPATI